MKQRISRFFHYAPLVLAAAVVLLPVCFVAVSSLMSQSELTAAYRAGPARPVFIPQQATLANFTKILLLTPNYLYKFWNSLLLTGAIVAGQVLVACMGGYALAKLRFPGQGLLFFLSVILMLTPSQVTLVPNYLVLEYLGLLDTWWALILPGMFAPYGVFLLSQFFSSMPSDILDAAKIDGAGQWQTFLRVVLPGNRTGVFSLVILSFIDNWNMVEQPLVFLKNAASYPLSIFLAQINYADLGVAFACGVLAMAPAVLMFLFLKDELIRGVEYSAMK